MNRTSIRIALFLTVMCVSLGAAAEPTVTLDCKNTPVREVASLMESQSGQTIRVAPTVPKDCKVTVKAEKLPLEKVLSQMSYGAGLFWQRRGTRYHIGPGKHPSSFHCGKADGLRLWVQDIVRVGETRKTKFATGARETETQPATTSLSLQLGADKYRRLALVRKLKSARVFDETGKELVWDKKQRKTTPSFRLDQTPGVLTVPVHVPTAYKGKVSVVAVFEAATKLGIVELRFKNPKAGGTAHEGWTMGTLKAFELDGRTQRLKIQCAMEKAPKCEHYGVAPPEWVVVGKDGAVFVSRAIGDPANVQTTLNLPKGMEPVELIYRAYVPMPPLRELKFEIKSIPLP